MFSSRQSHIQGFTQAEKLQQLMIAAAMGLAALAAFELVPAWAVRWFTAILFIAQIAHELYDDDLSAIKSPAFLLAAVSGFMYAIIPAAVVFLLQDSGQQALIPSPNRLIFLGDSAEYYILTFALLGLALHGVLRLTVTERSIRQAIPFSRPTSTCLSVISILLTGAAFLSNYLWYDPTFVSGALRTVYVPLQSVIIVFLVYQCAAKRVPLLLPLLTIVLAFTFLGLNAYAKPTIYIGLASVLVWVATSRPHARLLVMIGAGFLAFLAITFSVTQAIKYQEASIYRHNTINIAMGIESLGYKIIWRQVDTGDCFRRVLEKHGDEAFASSQQMFWIAALVPRFVWPDKPNLSLGSEYSVRYCDSTYKHRHSASITLLGQPTIKGGLTGLAVHGALLFAGIGFLTYVARRFPRLGYITVIALLPWWIDFDQDFALYVANLVKFFLLMCLVVLPVLIFGRQSGRIHA